MPMEPREMPLKEGSGSRKSGKVFGPGTGDREDKVRRLVRPCLSSIAPEHPAMDSVHGMFVERGRNELREC